MNMMISYQELVRTFLSKRSLKNTFRFRIHNMSSLIFGVSNPTALTPEIKQS